MRDMYNRIGKLSNKTLDGGDANSLIEILREDVIMRMIFSINLRLIQMVAWLASSGVTNKCLKIISCSGI